MGGFPYNMILRFIKKKNEKLLDSSDNTNDDYFYVLTQTTTF